MKLNSFDLEIAKIVDFGQDLHGERPLGITCAATLISDPQAEPLLWWAGKVGDKPRYEEQMTPQEAGALVHYLLEANERGYVPLTFNGLQFDFVILAEESGLWEECRELALGHIDMMFQFFCVTGYPVGLEAVSIGQGLEGKTEGMSGAEAPKVWPTQPERVLEYVAQDVILPLQLAQIIEESKMIRWITKAGRPKTLTKYDGWPGRWLTVEQCLELPLPDNSWMDRPMSREEFLRHWQNLPASAKPPSP